MDRDVQARALLQVVERRADLGNGLVRPSNVEPRMATTPMVFSSHELTASSAET